MHETRYIEMVFIVECPSESFAVSPFFALLRPLRGLIPMPIQRCVTSHHAFQAKERNSVLACMPLQLESVARKKPREVDGE